MAIAVKNTTPAVIEVIEPEKTEVILTLSLEEAQTILAVSGRIGGDPRTTPRGHFDRIRKALTEALGYGMNPWDEAQADLGSKIGPSYSGGLKFFKGDQQ